MLKDAADNNHDKKRGKQNHKGKLFAARHSEVPDQKPGGESGGDNDRQICSNQSRGNKRFRLVLQFNRPLGRCLAFIGT